MANKIESKVAEVKHTFDMTKMGDIFKHQNSSYIRTRPEYSAEAIRLANGETAEFDDDDEIVFLGEVTITRE